MERIAAIIAKKQILTKIVEIKELKNDRMKTKHERQTHMVSTLKNILDKNNSFAELNKEYFKGRIELDHTLNESSKMLCEEAIKSCFIIQEMNNDTIRLLNSELELLRLEELTGD